MQSHTHIYNSRHPTPSLSFLSSFPVFSTALLFFTPSVSCPPSPNTPLSPPSSVLLFLHTALFSLIALHLFLYPPTLHTDTAERISLSLSLTHSLALSLSISVIAPPLLSICLFPYLSPSVSISTSLPSSLSLSSSSLTISPRTLDSFYTLRKHPSFCSEKEKKNLSFFSFFFLFIHFSSVTTFCALLLCLFLS